MCFNCKLSALIWGWIARVLGRLGRLWARRRSWMPWDDIVDPNLQAEFHSSHCKTRGFPPWHRILRPSGVGHGEGTSVTETLENNPRSHSPECWTHTHDTHHSSLEYPKSTHPLHPHWLVSLMEKDSFSCWIAYLYTCTYLQDLSRLPCAILSPSCLYSGAISAICSS